ncbi:TPA: hypothetical protein ACX6Q6_003542 [Photobacterium damselae]
MDLLLKIFAILWMLPRVLGVLIIFGLIIAAAVGTTIEFAKKHNVSSK